MSLGLLLIILNYSSHSLLGKKEYHVKFSCTLRESVTSLYINSNDFGGELPKCMGYLSTTLTMLVLDNNKITREIPIEIGNLINLLRL